MNAYILDACLIIAFYFLFKYIKNENKRRNFLISSSMLLFLRMALRSLENGTDLQRYRSRYLSILSSDDSIWESVYGEPLYVWTNKMCGRISEENGYRIFLMLCSFWIVFSFSHLIYKYSDQLLISCFAFLAFDFYLFAFSGLRQAVAMAFLMWAFDFIVQKKLAFFLLAVIMATGFHRTAVTFSICYLVQYFKWSVQRVLLAAVIAGIIIYNIEDIGKFIVSYVGTNFEQFESGGSIGTVSMIILALLISGLIFNSPIKNKNPLNTSLNNVMLISLVLQTLSYISYNFTRLNFYYFQFAVLFLPNIAARIDTKDNKIRFSNRTKQICIAALLVILFAIYLSRLSLEIYDAVPYRYMWDNGGV